LDVGKFLLNLVFLLGSIDEFSYLFGESEKLKLDEILKAELG
jgi:hypothetical protein